MGLVPPPGRVEGGEIVLNGRSVTAATPAEWQRIRSEEIAMVFQDPMTSLNPVLTIGYQLTEGLRRHLGMTRKEAEEEAVRLLDLVGIPSPHRRLSSHPHELSGGQRQRVMIAMALSCRPSVLIADEPTTALDVTIQDQIVRLVKRLQAELGMAILWITHDLALVSGLVDRVAVMYAGTIVEEAPVGALFTRPRHPYTAGLMASMPSLGSDTGADLRTIPGRPPDLRMEIAGCTFADRCPMTEGPCRTERPPAHPVADGHQSACLRWEEL
jgi:oligopeptide/dipeptide ABC transporter ATP-binding protein